METAPLFFSSDTRTEISWLIPSKAVVLFIYYVPTFTYGHERKNKLADASGLSKPSLKVDWPLRDRMRSSVI